MFNRNKSIVKPTFLLATILLICLLGIVVFAKISPRGKSSHVQVITLNAERKTHSHLVRHKCRNNKKHDDTVLVYNFEKKKKPCKKPIKKPIKPCKKPKCFFPSPNIIVNIPQMNPIVLPPQTIVIQQPASSASSSSSATSSSGSSPNVNVNLDLKIPGGKPCGRKCCPRSVPNPQPIPPNPIPVPPTPVPVPPQPNPQPSPTPTPVPPVPIPSPKPVPPQPNPQPSPKPVPPQPIPQESPKPIPVPPVPVTSLKPVPPQPSPKPSPIPVPPVPIRSPTPIPSKDCIPGYVPSQFPTFKQCDPQWGSLKLGTSSSSICKAGCLISAIISGLNGIGRSNMNPKDFNIWLKGNGGFLKGNLYVWASIEKKFGVKYSGRTTDILGVTVNNICDGRLVILKLLKPPGKKTEHFVLAIGYNSQTKTFTVVDSAFDRTTYKVSEIARSDSYTFK